MEQNSPHNPSHRYGVDCECNQVRSPRKVGEDLRPLMIVGIYQFGEKNTLQNSLWIANTMGPSAAQGEDDQLANLGKKSPIIQHQGEINSINLYAFGDASSQGLSAEVYAVTYQPSGISKGLVVAKSRIAKNGLTIPRLELLVRHMITNLACNAKEALQGFQ